MPYEPIPFVAPLIDQTPQRLKLADLLYQANMARSQAELQRQMQVAQMIAQFGQNIGAGIESWMDRQQRERALAIQAERENRLASAQEAQNQLMLDRMAAEDRRNTLALQQDLYEKARGGTQAWESDAASTFGPYANLMERSPELTATRQEITPAQTMQIGPSAMPAQPDVLESRPMNLAVLAGTAEPVQTTYEGYLTKPFSAAETKAMEEQAAESSRRNALASFSAKMSDPSVSDADKMSEADRLVALGVLTPAQKTAMFPTERRIPAEERYLTGLMSGPEEAAYTRRKGQLAAAGRAPEKPPAPEKMTSDQRIVDTYQALDAAGYGTAAAMMEHAFGLVGKASAEAKAKRYEMIVKSNRNNPEKAADQIAEDAYRTASTKIGSATEREEYNAVVEGLNYIQKWKDALSKVPNTPQAQKLKQTYMSTGLTRKLAEDFANLFGQTTDPALKSLQTEFNDLAYNYRRGMSGAAFGVKEDEQYRNLNQDIKNDAPLNMALMEGMEARLSSKFNNFWNNIGGADAERYANRFRRQYARIGGRAIGGGGIPPRPRGQQ